MWEDPILKEIHEIQAQRLARFNGDVDAYYRHLQEVAQENRRRGVVYVDAPEREELPRSDAA